MVSVWKNVVVLLGVWAVAQTLVNTPAEAQLSPFFYKTSCPLLLPIVGLEVKIAIQNQSRVAASLLRLHFHDCFVQGCDASVLLDNTTDHVSEKFAPPNKNSLPETAFDTIDIIKAAVEAACPNVVSCADIVALAAFFSVVLSGGPHWYEPLGRRDSFFSNFAEFINLPSPNTDLPTIKGKFADQGLTVDDTVALLGAHTIGLATCAAINIRLYDFAGTGGPDPTLNATLLASLEKNCPNIPPGVGNNDVTNKMDPVTPTVFDNYYYKNLLVHKGLFTSDEELYTAADDTKALVQQYAASQSDWFSDFAQAMIKMGNLPLNGTNGEIRKNCRVRNPVTSIAHEEERIKFDSLHAEQVDGGGTEDLEQFMAKVMTQILRTELELQGLVDETFTEKHADM